MSTPRRVWQPWESGALERSPIRTATDRCRSLFGRPHDSDAGPCHRLLSAPDCDSTAVGADCSSFFDNLQRKISLIYPDGSVLLRRMSSTPIGMPTAAEGTSWLEVVPSHVHTYEGVGPVHPVRLVISATQLFYLQVNYPMTRTVQHGLLGSCDDEQLLQVLQQLCEYQMCPGIPDYEEAYQSLRHHPKQLQMISIGNKVIRYESSKCLIWHMPTNRKSTPLDRRHNMCIECKTLDKKLTKEAQAAAFVTETQKAARTLPSSNYPFSLLSPASQKSRVRKLMQERKTIVQKVNKYSSTAVTLDDDQDKEMAAIVHTINTDPDLHSELDELFLEADRHQEGHGTVLQEIWECDCADTDKELFDEDQTRNRK